MIFTLKEFEEKKNAFEQNKVTTANKIRTLKTVNADLNAKLDDAISSGNAAMYSSCVAEMSKNDAEIAVLESFNARQAEKGAAFTDADVAESWAKENEAYRIKASKQLKAIDAAKKAYLKELSLLGVIRKEANEKRNDYSKYIKDKSKLARLGQEASVFYKANLLSNINAEETELIEAIGGSILSEPIPEEQHELIIIAGNPDL